eukprot:6184800-Pleurochrysis_carterae.AAC.4
MRADLPPNHLKWPWCTWYGKLRSTNESLIGIGNGQAILKYPEPIPALAATIHCFVKALDVATRAKVEKTRGRRSVFPQSNALGLSLSPNALGSRNHNLVVQCVAGQTGFGTITCNN